MHTSPGNEPDRRCVAAARGATAPQQGSNQRPARNYGTELILDLHGCDPSKFTRADLTVFFRELCASIEMEAADLHFWDDLDAAPGDRETEPHLIGTSAIQFIRTSNITVHTLDVLERVYVNVFSCKPFDAEQVAAFCVRFFGGTVVGRTEVDRV